MCHRWRNCRWFGRHQIVRTLNTQFEQIWHCSMKKFKKKRSQPSRIFFLCKLSVLLNSAHNIRDTPTCLKHVRACTYTVGRTTAQLWWMVISSVERFIFNLNTLNYETPANSSFNWFKYLKKLPCKSIYLSFFYMWERSSQEAPMNKTLILSF